MKKLSTSKGFTLIELLVVITIITALGVAVFVALDPAKRLAEARNARRTTDVDSVLTAIHQAIVDSKGSIPSNLVAGTQQLGSDATGCALGGSGACSVTATACSNLMLGTINVSKYLKSMPTDPLNGTAGKTNYAADYNASSGIVTIKACGAEGSGVIVEASR